MNKFISIMGLILMMTLTMITGCGSSATTTIKEDNATAEVAPSSSLPPSVQAQLKEAEEKTCNVYPYIRGRKIKIYVGDYRRFTVEGIIIGVTTLAPPESDVLFILEGKGKDAHLIFFPRRNIQFFYILDK